MGNFDLEFQIMTQLLVVFPEGRHGYRVQERLRERGVVVGQGSVYRVLGRLEAKGWIRTRQGRKEDSFAGTPRTYCTLTAEGLAAYHKIQSEMTKIAERVLASVQEVTKKRADLGGAASG